MSTFAALWAIGTIVAAAAIIVRNYRRDGRRLDIRAAHRRDASLTARLTTPSPVLAHCDQASDIAAGLERRNVWRDGVPVSAQDENGRRRLPLPAPDETPLPVGRGGEA
jgi:hypothetical protein